MPYGFNDRSSPIVTAMAGPQGHDGLLLLAAAKVTTLEQVDRLARIARLHDFLWFVVKGLIESVPYMGYNLAQTPDQVPLVATLAALLLPEIFATAAEAATRGLARAPRYSLPPTPAYQHPFALNAAFTTVQGLPVLATFIVNVVLKVVLGLTSVPARKGVLVASAVAAIWQTVASWMALDSQRVPTLIAGRYRQPWLSSKNGQDVEAVCCLRVATVLWRIGKEIFVGVLFRAPGNIEGAFFHPALLGTILALGGSVFFTRKAQATSGEEKVFWELGGALWRQCA